MVKRSSKRSACLGCTLAATAGAFLLLALMWWLVSRKYDPPLQRPFDAAAWSSPAARNGARRAMIEDLLANHLRPGVSRAEVIDLLGVEHLPRCRPEDPHLGYVLGRSRFVIEWLDWEWLCLFFDERERLLRAELHDH